MADARDGLADRVLAAAINNDGRSRLSELLGDGKADAERRAGDDGGLAGKIDDHREPQMDELPERSAFAAESRASGSKNE